jgi:hypothetical protein
MMREMPYDNAAVNEHDRSVARPFVQGYRPNNRSTPGRAPQPASATRKGCAEAGQPAGKAYPLLHTAQVADLLHVSPKTVSRWAKEGKLPS